MNEQQAKELLIFYNKYYGSGDLSEGMAQTVVNQFLQDKKKEALDLLIRESEDYGLYGYFNKPYQK
jgi:hypothetical protein